jgi:hypothetical protein
MQFFRIFFKDARYEFSNQVMEKLSNAVNFLIHDS